MDLLAGESYSECNVSEDPVLFLPCGHFYTVSTMDGLFELNRFFKVDRATCEAQEVVPLAELVKSDKVSEKPKVCPDCRAPIHSLKRYGRVLRLIELRALERKHLISMKQTLSRIEECVSSNPSPKVLRLIEHAEKQLQRGPMRKVFEASRSCDGEDLTMNVLRPPATAELHCLDLKVSLLLKILSSSSEEQVEDNKKDEHFAKAKAAVERGIKLAESTNSTLKLCKFRLSLVKLYICMDRASPAERFKQILDLVLSNPLQHLEELRKEARKLKVIIDQPSKEDIAGIMRAMRSERGAGHMYGGNFSDHWYECPNGHPFYIGECGQAMQVSHCIECGAQVGGRGHRLLTSNNQGTRINLSS